MSNCVTFRMRFILLISSLHRRLSVLILGFARQIRLCRIRFFALRTQWVVSVLVALATRRKIPTNYKKQTIMPILTFDKVLKIILTILNVLSAALRAFNFDVPVETEDPNINGTA